MRINPITIEQLAFQLKELSESLVTSKPSTGSATLAPATAKRLQQSVASAYSKLREVMEDLDPIKQPGFVFQPSDPTIAGRIVGLALVARERSPLSLAVNKFYGSGVYAIYYNGDFPAYSKIARKEHPIYVGKAEPATPHAKTALEQKDRLSRRLNDHFKTISKAMTTLKLEDFEFRALVVQSGYESAAENYLIHLFKPIWNNETKLCKGFGKHGDDPQTRKNQRSPWDTLHPGRDWAHRDPAMQDARSTERIVADIAKHFVNHPPVESIDEILHRFLADMRG